MVSKMKTPSPRRPHRPRPGRKSLRLRPGREALEARCFLSGADPSGLWVGQDARDLVGRSSTPGPSGIQDIHIALSDLPTDQEIVFADVQGLGGGQWLYQGRPGPWAAALVADTETGAADLFIEPFQIETGRLFTVDLEFEDGSTERLWIDGGEADPSLRMPDAAAQAVWLGQTGADRVGTGPSVGPDGFQDAVIRLDNLTAEVAIDRVIVEGPRGVSWQSGVNPAAVANAELIRSPDDPSQGRLFLQPGLGLDLEGAALEITILYANQTSDQAAVSAEAVDPQAAVAPPEPPAIRAEPLELAWLGQMPEAEALGGPGAVGLKLEGLPTGLEVAAVSVAGSSRGLAWGATLDPDADAHLDPHHRPLAFSRDPDDPSTARLAFPPVPDQSGQPLTVRVVFADGSSALGDVATGAVDFDKVVPAPDPNDRIVARPGDDLHTLVLEYDLIHLESGVHELDRPLVLSRPVAITAEPGATLQFDQQELAEPWVAAIQIEQSQTRLEGFAVRFDGPVRWDWSVPFDPAVIASIPDGNRRQFGLELKGLDLEAPPVTASNTEPAWAPKLIRFVSADSGRIVGNRLRGGATHLVGGPWEIVGNTHTGAVPGTMALEAFTVNRPRDLVVAGNLVRPEADSGRVYRFLVLTQSGDRIEVADNDVAGLGPRDDDDFDHPNAAELILTEAYRVRFEGRPLGLSEDGRILQIPEPQGATPRVGDVVSILDGPFAGTWVRIAEVIDPRTLLLEEALPTERPLGVVSVATGFQETSFTGNRLDARGRSEAAPLVIVGAQFGTTVSGNTILGGGTSRIVSMASEAPVQWGWTLMPVLDLDISGNRFEETQGGLRVGTLRSAAVKTGEGRLYFKGSVNDNIFKWSSEFLEDRDGAGHPVGLTIGDVRALDPFEARVAMEGNELGLPVDVEAGTAVAVAVATVNGKTHVDARWSLPVRSAVGAIEARLAHDTGVDPDDGLTRDPRIQLASDPAAVAYEYRLEHESTYRSVTELFGGAFEPAGLDEGFVTVFVRGLDEAGRPGPESSLSFVWDATPPRAAEEIEHLGLDRFRLTPNRDAAGYEFRLDADGPFEPVTPVSPTEFRINGIPFGVSTIDVRAIDAAGNTGPSASVDATIARPDAVWLGQRPWADFVGPWSHVQRPDGFQDIGIRLTGLPTDRSVSSIDLQGKGGGRWQYSVPNSVHWKLAVVTAPNATGAAIFAQPYQFETGREYLVTVRFDDGTSVEVYLQGGVIDPTLPSWVTTARDRGGARWRGLGSPRPAMARLDSDQGQRPDQAVSSPRVDAALMDAPTTAAAIQAVEVEPGAERPFASRSTASRARRLALALPNTHETPKDSGTFEDEPNRRFRPATQRPWAAWRRTARSLLNLSGGPSDGGG